MFYTGVQRALRSTPVFFGHLTKPRARTAYIQAIALSVQVVRALHSPSLASSIPTRTALTNIPVSRGKEHPSLLLLM